MKREDIFRRTSKNEKMKVEYLGNAISIETQLTAILEKTMQYLVIDIEQYIDKADELATKIESIKRAKNCNVIIYAPGYVRESRIIQELNFRGIRFISLQSDRQMRKKNLNAA